MSHDEQLAFFRCVAKANHNLVSGASILEIGSYDVNGTVRAIFAAAASYTGVDLVQGPSVDLVQYGHRVDLSNGTFDVAISGECFEHDPFWVQTFMNMVRLVRPGGLVAFTCASVGRLEHGTRRTLTSDSPGTQAEGSDYYRNLRKRDFEPLDLHGWFDTYKFWYQPYSFDLYFCGVRSASESLSDYQHQAIAVLPGSDTVTRETDITRRWLKVARLPMRFLAKVLTDEPYQLVALAYWRLVSRILRFREMVK